MADHSNQTTLIIGASSSFGRIISEHLFAAGHGLTLAHSGSGEYHPPKGITGSIIAFDVTDDEAVDSAFSRCSPVDNLVYSVAAPIEFKKFSEEQWSAYEAHWQTQVKGLWRVVQSLLKHEHPLRHIFVIGSAIIDHPMPRLGPYLTAKYALAGLCETLRLELGSSGVSVILYSPGATGKGLSKDFSRVMLEVDRSFGGSPNPEDIAVDIVEKCQK